MYASILNPEAGNRIFLEQKKEETNSTMRTQQGFSGKQLNDFGRIKMKSMEALP